MMYGKYKIICTCLCLWYMSPGQAHTMVTAVRPVVETPDSTATSSTPEAADTTAVQPVKETPVSTAVSTSSKPKLDHTVDFNPLDYLYPDRYVEKGDTFRNRFLDHLYVGFTTGFSQVAPKGRRAMKNGIPFGGVAGYDFNRLHGLRATLLHTNYDMKDGDGTVKQWETDIDYVFHLSDYLYGYDKRRIFRISPTLGVGYIHSVFQGERASIFKGQAGINVGIGLGRNAKFFIEPFFSALTDQADHSGHTNVSKYDIQYGVKAGLTVNMDNTNDFYNSDVVYTRGFFYELAQGVTFYDSDDLGFFKTTGTGYKIAVGRWFDPIVGLRLSATASEYYWSYNTTAATEARPSYETRYKGSMFAGRLEGLVNPLNFFPYWRQVRHPFEMNIAVGGEYGWLTKYIPGTDNGLKCNYAGFTGAATFLYSMDKETSFFVEPRVVVANFREPYVNVAREASFTETSASISLGVRVCAANRKERASWPPYIFEPRLFSGVQVGGLKHMRSVNTVGDFALNYSGQFYVGYHLGPYVSLKAAIEYETLNENKYGSYVVDFMGVEKQFTALWQYRYNLLNIKLAYMLNLSNVYQKYDLNRKFNLFVEGGALYSKCMSDNARIYSGELEVGSSPRPLSAANPSGAPALLLGAVAQYRINDQWSLLLEPEVHYYLKNGFIGGEVLSPFNDVVAKVSLGTSYTF